MFDRLRGTVTERESSAAGGSRTPSAPAARARVEPERDLAGRPDRGLVAAFSDATMPSGPRIVRSMTRIRSDGRPDARTIRRLIVKGTTARSKPYTRVKQSALYTDTKWSNDQRDLILALHGSKVKFTDDEVRKILIRTPLPTVVQVETEKASAAATSPKKIKHNVHGKAKQKRKSGIVKGWAGTAKLSLAFKSSVGGKKKRTVLPKHVARGLRMIGLGQRALANLLAATNANNLQGVMSHVQHAQANNLTQHSGTIGTTHVATDTHNMSVQPTDEQGFLAMTHARLSGTNNRSDYGAFVRPEPGQTTGTVHPLQNPATNASFAVLNAIEAVRNKGQFIISMLLKHEAIAKGYMTLKQAVNPTKFGTQEIKEVSGQQRDQFSSIIPANTDYTLDFIVDQGGAPLADALYKVLDEQDQGHDTKALEATLVAAIETALLNLTKT